MQKKLRILLIFVLLGTTAWGQYGFQKVYNHHDIDTFSILSDIYVQDDSIYLTLGSGNTTTRLQLTFAQIDSAGNLDEIVNYWDPDHLQKVHFGNVDTDTNSSGHLVNVYRDIFDGGNSFRLIEYDLQGNRYLDTVYTAFPEDSVQFFDYSKLLHTRDSSYLVNVNFNDFSENGTQYNLNGTLLMKIRSSGDIIWKKRRHCNTDCHYKGLNLKKQSTDTFRMHTLESERFGPGWAEQNWAKNHFLTLDKNGNVLEQKTFQDGQYCYAIPGSSYFDNDTIYLQYFDSKLFGESGNNDYFQVKPVLAKIDPDMNIVWKKELQDFWGNGVSYSGSIQRIRKVNDTAFVAARAHLDILEGSILNPPITKTVEVRFYNFSADGEYNWIRYYHYYPLDSMNDASYEINDIEKLSDGGFVLGGQVRNPKFTSQNKPGQFAYLLRTNCLGFLSPPEAQFSYETNKNEVFFTNNSMNAGRYTWIFGDGDTLHTDEEVDSIAHTYTDEGQYDVTLIAHGCNGAADTVALQVQVEEGAYGNIGDHFFHLYPNPVAQGEVITVESGTIENASLQFYTMGGKKVKQVALPDAKSIYFIEHNFSSGGYLVRLIKNGKLIEEKKMVVQ